MEDLRGEGRDMIGRFSHPRRRGVTPCRRSGDTGRRQAPTTKDCLLAAVSPSASVTISLTYLVSATLNALVILQPLIVSQIVEPSTFSKLHLQDSGPSPVERVPSSTTGVPTFTPVGTVQVA